MSISEFAKEIEPKLETEYSFVNESDSFNYKIRFIPQAVLFLNHFNGHPTKKDLDSFNNHKFDLLSFVLKIQPKDEYKFGKTKSFESSVCTNERKLKYLTEQIQENVTIYSQGDSLKPVYSHFERSFGLKPDITLHIGFNSRKQWKNSVKLKFINKLTTNTQNVVFEIPTDIFTNTPNIKL